MVFTQTENLEIDSFKTAFACLPLENLPAPSWQTMALVCELYKGMYVIFFLCTSSAKQNALHRIIILLLHNKRTRVSFSAFLVFLIFFLILAEME